MRRRESNAGAVILALTLLACLPARPLMAQSVIYVPDDYGTIQAAVSASVSGDTIIVRDGAYTGYGNRNINFQGKAIALRSENGPDSTVIDCEYSGRGFIFVSGETSASSLSGFTIKAGHSTNGGGIYIRDSSPTISNCAITNNRAIGVNGPPHGFAGHGYGGGIYIEGTGSPVISRCVISGNIASGGEGGFLGEAGDGFGGGIYTVSSVPVITHCSIHSNHAAGGDNYHSVSWAGSGFGGGVDCSPAIINNCLIYYNAAYAGWAAEEFRNPWKYQGEGWGGGVLGGTITNSTIADNMASTAIGGASSSIRNSIIWGNIAYGDYARVVVQAEGTVTFSNVEGGYPGKGNSYLDPQFAPGTDNYRLTENSPCVDAGDNLFVTWGDDLDDNPRILEGGRAGRRVDMGAYEFPGGGFLLDEGFDGFHLGVRPAGWTFVNCDDNGDTCTGFGEYGRQSPSIRLDSGLDAVVTSSFEMSRSEFLVFWVRGMGTDATSRLLVEEHYGADWNNLALINPIPVWGAVMGPFTLNPDSTRLRFSYQKVLGDLAMDDIQITAPSATPFGYKTPSPTPFGYKTPSPTVTPTPPATPVPTVTPSMTPIPSVTSTPTVTPTAPPVATPTVHPTPEHLVLDSGDYNGDGLSDIAVFQPARGLWAVRGLGRIYFGQEGDIPAPGDYDGDGVTDISVFRPGSGLWAVKNLTRFYFGGNRDIPVPGDYGGTGVTLAGVFQPSAGLWAVRGLTRVYFGRAGDLPVPGDYAGEGMKDMAIFRPSTGLWAIRGVTRTYFGGSGDRPVPGTYRWYASGKTVSPFRDEAAIFRPETGLWAIRGWTRYYFGQTGDSPVRGDFAGNSLDDIGIFRSSSGLWAVRGKTRAYFGAGGDIPVTR